MEEKELNSSFVLAVNLHNLPDMYYFITVLSKFPLNLVGTRVIPGFNIFEAREGTVYFSLAGNQLSNSFGLT